MTSGRRFARGADRAEREDDEGLVVLRRAIAREALHGRYGKPCPACGDAVQRLVYAANEANYCATCQTAGRLLADRALSRLLKDDWPKTLEEAKAARREA